MASGAWQSSIHRPPTPDPRSLSYRELRTANCELLFNRQLPRLSPVTFPFMLPFRFPLLRPITRGRIQPNLKWLKIERLRRGR